MAETALELAERALAGVRPADGAQVTVTSERSLMLRFARSRPTQSTGIDDLTVEITVVRDGHVASATQPAPAPSRDSAECTRAGSTGSDRAALSA